MEISKEKIAFIEDMITALTLKRVLLLCLLAITAIVMLAIFENRSSLFVKMYKNTAAPLVEWNLSNESKSQLISIADNSVVGGIIFFEVDLKKNQRTLKFFHITNPDKSAESASVIVKVSKLQPHSLFDSDSKNTDQMVSMLNNEFKCVPIKDTALFRIIPEIDKKFAYLCRMAVPPYFGEFLGYLAIGLNREPSEYEADALRIELNRISVDVYFRDITNRPSKSN